MYKAHITVTLRSSILDPQGKAAHHALGELGFASVQSVRIGKFIELNIEAESVVEAKVMAENACKQLLANAVMEDFHVEIQSV